MIPTRRTIPAAALTLAVLTPPLAAAAGTITANCTGMIDNRIFRIESGQPEQEIEGLGPANVSVDDGAIRLEGAFGEYRLDLKAGTLYHNDRDTGLYCTYRGIRR